MQISDKTFLVTGASGGIGQAVAEALQKAGANLILVGRNQNRLSKICDDLSTREHNVVGVVADLANHAGRSSIAHYLQNEKIKLDGVVHIAGINGFGKFEDLSEDLISDMINTNVTSTILLTQTLMPFMQANKSVIVNVGSTFGSIGFPCFSVYSASKFAIRGFTQALQREYADTGVRFIYVAPRATQTSMNTDAVNEMNQVLGNKSDSPETVAAGVLRAIDKEQKETYMGWPEKLFVRINQLLPNLVSQSLIKNLDIIKHFATKNTLIPAQENL